MQQRGLFSSGDRLGPGLEQENLGAPCNPSKASSPLAGRQQKAGESRAACAAVVAAGRSPAHHLPNGLALPALPLDQAPSASR